MTTVFIRRGNCCFVFMCCICYNFEINLNSDINEKLWVLEDRPGWEVCGKARFQQKVLLAQD